MTIKIDDALTDALTLRLAEGLKRVAFLFGVDAQDFHWVSEPSFALPEGVGNKLTSICGEHGLAEFLDGEVNRRLDNDPSYDLDTVERLTDVESFSDTIRVSKELIGGLKALPYRYRLVVPLPDAFSKEYIQLCSNFELGQGVSIVSGEQISRDFPTRTGVENRDAVLEARGGSEVSIKPANDKLYLMQRCSGYIGVGREAPILTDFKSILRQFLGISLAVGVFHTGWNRDSLEVAYVAHRVDGDAQIVAAEELPQQLIQLYGSLRGRDMPIQESQVKAATARLDAVKAAFAATEHGRKLAVSSMWYLRSILSQETLDAVLEATISLEALFGGASGEGAKIASTLASRCAYRIGQNVYQRDRVLEVFPEIYNLRSRIVHEGHHRFNVKERALLKEARDICKRSLMFEARLAAG